GHPMVTVSVPGSAPTTAQTRPRPVILEWLTTTDHKKIGIMYLYATFFFFLVGGLMAELIRVQLAVPNNNFISASTYNQLFTMHGSIMVFLWVIPVFVGFGNYFVPLM